jgi:Arylsulfotransferase (ASST)
MVSQQHAPVALDNGRILVFDNGNFRAGQHVVRSRVVEIDPATQTVVWSYTDPMASSFYKPCMGQRLPNRNTHITESATGRLFGVTPDGEVVWEFILPWFAPYPDEAARRTDGGMLNSVFQTFPLRGVAGPWLGGR